MDALAGYGSDSSSDASAHDEPPAKKAPLSGLLADYSDDENDEDDEQWSVPSELLSTTNNDASSSANNKIHLNASLSLPPPPKKQKMEPLQQQGLPPPRLTTSSTEPMSWIELRHDYTTKYRSNHQITSESSSLQQPHQGEQNMRMEQQKWGPTLQSLYDTFYAASSSSSSLLQLQLKTNHHCFATHLKSQKDFGNPHMFPSVISHFGIDAHGSNLLGMVDTFDDFEYANRLVATEEQARIRAAERSQQQQQQQTIPTINDQIQRAMSTTSNHIQTNGSAL